MGQYYMAYTKYNGKEKIYNREVVINGKAEYTPAKLTEHSWWFNDFVNGVCKDIYERKIATQVAWVGDYTNELLDSEEPLVNGLKKEELETIYNKVWKEEKNSAVKENNFNLDGKYLVNETKKEYIDCNKYFKINEKENWCFHPLPLLTCTSNGLGGGDYRYPTDDSDFELIGSWTLDKIAILDEKPLKYSEINVIFKENI